MEYAVAGRLEDAGREISESAVTSLCRDIRALPEFIPLGKDRVDRLRYTSRDMLETELQMRHASDKLSARQKHGVKDDILANAPSAEKLGDEQRAAFGHVTCKQALSLVVGFAGTGKSTMLGAAREAWEGQGYRVRGACLSSMAAKSLQDGSQIKSRTLASTLYALDNIGEQQRRISEMEARRDAIDGKTTAAKTARFNMSTQIDKRKAQLDAIRLTERDVVIFR